MDHSVNPKQRAETQWLCRACYTMDIVYSKNERVQESPLCENSPSSTRCKTGGNSRLGGTRPVVPRCICRELQSKETESHTARLIEIREVDILR